MRLAANLVAVALMLASAYLLYAQVSATRRLENRVQTAERLRERTENDIAVLKAEREHLARPARIEPAARALGMIQPTRNDYISLDALLQHAGDAPSPRTR